MGSPNNDLINAMSALINKSTRIAVNTSTAYVVNLDPSRKYSFWHKGFNSSSVQAIDNVKLMLSNTAPTTTTAEEINTEILSPGDLVEIQQGIPIVQLKVIPTVGGVGEVMISIASTDSIVAGGHNND